MSTITNNQMNNQQPEALLRKAIRQDTQQLSDLRLAIGAFIENAALVREHREKFLGLILQLRGQLARHFALKETNGYFEDSIVEEPRLAGSIEHLRTQHTELFQMISQIADASRDISDRAISADQLNEILESLRALDFALQQHEREESQILYEATDVDLGGQG